MENRKFCYKCGNELDNEAEFCSKCGCKQNNSTSFIENKGLIVFLLALFLGMLGIHRFYVGKTGTGIIMLLLTLTAIGSIISGLWVIIDLIMIVVGNFEDANGNKISFIK